MCRLLCMLLAGVLVAGLALPGSAGAPDPVRAVLDRVRQADALVARILGAVRARDTSALRARIEEYRTVMRGGGVEIKHLSPDNPGTQHALDTVREVTLKGGPFAQAGIPT